MSNISIMKMFVIRSVAKAIEHEVWRQITALENGETIDNETR